MNTVYEPCRNTPVAADVDLCVVGGSTAGVFAAVKAARMGLKVALVEKANMLGGTATLGLVNVWHSLYDTSGQNEIIAGLTKEVEERLSKDGAIETVGNESIGVRFNSARLAIILDRLVTEANIRLFLHTYYSGLLLSKNEIQAVFIENKDGRQAICAKFFIDATGDGDLCRDLKIPSYQNYSIQPPSSCFLLQITPGKQYDLGKLIKAHGNEFGLDDDWGWGGAIPGVSSLSFRADNHVFNLNPLYADQLTQAEIEGRRKSAAVSDLLKTYIDPGYELAALCSSLGIRETIHYKTVYQVTDDDLLLGRSFENSILHGTYRLDIHHHHDNGITFLYLDGRKDTFYGKGSREEHSDWREERGIHGEIPTFYSAPWEMLLQDRLKNLIAVGRMINAEESAFGALRVMVNLNQLGEAAGVAAALCLDQNCSVQALNGHDVVTALRRGGSAI